MGKKNDNHILAVSGDGDWTAFAEKSEYIDVVADLTEALTKLQEDADEAEAIVERLLSSIKSGKNTDLADAFERLLSDEISGANVYPEADSFYTFETEDVEVSLDHFEFDNEDGAFSPQIVQVGRAIIVASISLRILVTATATFSLFTYDSIDKDYVGIGSATARKDDEEVSITVLLTFEGDFRADDIELTKVELTDGLDLIHFGEVEPDYGEPDYEGLTDGLDTNSEREPDSADEGQV